MRNIFLAAFLILLSSNSIAQFPGGGGNRMGGGRMGGQMNVGHFYGKLIDSKTNKGIGGVTIQLKGNKFDTVTKQLKEAILKTVITENNGDFSLEGLTVFGSFKFKATAVGYKNLETQLSFGIKMPQGGAPDASTMQQMMGLADKDLGNLKMEPDASDLGTVTVSTSSSFRFTLSLVAILISAMLII
jgi:hypothetical protein